MVLPKCSLGLVALALLAGLPEFSTSSFALAADPIKFTNFEYFKNSGLKVCSNGTQVQQFNKRDPKGGGKGGGGGSSSGGSKSGSSSSKKKKVYVQPFIDVRSFEKGSTDYCQYMKGTGVIIPSIPNQTAFFPWWPTYLLQLCSLVASYIAIRVATTKVERTNKIPIYLWAFVVLDTARIIAWFFKVGQGLSNPYRFAWTSVVLWMLPLAYVYVIRAILSNRVATVTSAKVDYAPVQQVDPYGNPIMPYGQTAYDPQAYGQPGYGQEAYDPMVKQPVTSTRAKAGRSIVKMVALTIPILLAVIMWSITVATIFYHFRPATTKYQRTETYLQDPRVTADPSVLGDLPGSCVDFLRGYSLQNNGFFYEGFDQLLSAGFCAMQFIITSLALLKIAWKEFRGTFKSMTDGIIACATPTIVALILTLVATAIYIGVVSGAQKNGVTMTYTTNSTRAGGCTFATFSMDGTFGYLDAPYEIGQRVAFSALGVA